MRPWVVVVVFVVVVAEVVGRSLLIASATKMGSGLLPLIAECRSVEAIFVQIRFWHGKAMRDVFVAV
jgi:hypothetical protein